MGVNYRGGIFRIGVNSSHLDSLGCNTLVSAIVPAFWAEVPKASLSASVRAFRNTTVSPALLSPFPIKLLPCINQISSALHRGSLWRALLPE